MAVAPWRLSGVVYGALLNHAPALAALGEAAHRPPHKAPPVAPVLQLKPLNALAADGSALPLPPDAPALELGATLGIVIGRTACRLTSTNALAHVAGFLAMADLSVPADSHYRPAVRFRARDGSCVIGERVADAAMVPAPDALSVRVEVDGRVAQQTTTGERVRGVADLLVAVTDFMTLQPGDVLMLGPSAGAPRLRAGQSWRIVIEGVGEVQGRVLAPASTDGVPA